MKKMIALTVALALVACSKEQPQQYVQPQPVYQQAPVIVQAPAPQVVVQERGGDSGTALVAGAALGALAATALHNSNDRGPRYDDRAPAQQTNVTHVTVNKTYVNPPAPEKQVAPVAAPVPTAAPKNYAAAWAQNVPAPSIVPAPVAKPTAPPAAVAPNFTLQMKKAPPPALYPTPTGAKPPAAPAKPVSYGYKAPAPTVSYKQGTTTAKK